MGGGCRGNRKRRHTTRLYTSTHVYMYVYMYVNPRKSLRVEYTSSCIRQHVLAIFRWFSRRVSTQLYVGLPACASPFALGCSRGAQPSAQRRPGRKRLQAWRSRRGTSTPARWNRRFRLSKQTEDGVTWFCLGRRHHASGIHKRTHQQPRTTAECGLL